MQTWWRSLTWLTTVEITSWLLYLSLSSLCNPVAFRSEGKGSPLVLLWSLGMFDLKPKLGFFTAWPIHPFYQKLLLLSAEVFTSICDFVASFRMFLHKIALIFRPGTMSVWEMFLSFKDIGSEIINNNSYRVTRSHISDELIRSSNKSCNIDEKLVISEEGSRVFN